MARSALKSTASAAKGAPVPGLKIGIVMGSQSDWETMQHTANLLQSFDIAFETKIVSAHRTPKRLYDYAATAAGRGLQLIIAGAGGAAHLPGMMAAITHVPVLGVPVQSKSLDGLDSLLSIAQMPAGIPVGTLAVGKAGAINAGLLAVAIMARGDRELDRKLQAWRRSQTDAVGLIPVDEDYVPGKKAAKATTKGRKKK